MIRYIFFLIFFSTTLVGQEIETIAWDEVSRKHLGTEIIATGQIVRTYDSGRVTYLNFSEDWQGTFTGVIFSDTACDFRSSPVDFFLGREVLFKGVVTEYKGALQIIIDRPQNIWCADGTVVAVNPPITGNFPVGEAMADGVRMLSWNVENFFDEVDDPYRNEGNTRPISEARKQRIARVINHFNADIVALQEIENRGVLEAFNKRYLKSLGYEVVLFEGNDQRGIDNAVLTRLPIESVTSYRHSDYQDKNDVTRRFGRDLLQVRLGEPFNGDVFVVHFKSQLGDEDSSNTKREAEALKAISVIKNEMDKNESYRCVIAGDFNEVLELDESKNELAVKYFVDAGLIDACVGTEKYSYNKPPYLTRIDFAFCSPALAPFAKGDIVDSMGGVKLTCASDHYPVIVEFSDKK